MKKKYGKIIAVALCAIMLLQTFGAGGASLIANASTNGKTGVLYSTDFDSTDFNKMTSSGIWDIERVERTDATAPTVSGGKMQMVTKNSVQFKWTEVDNVGEYDPTKIYTFEFDARVTDSGNGQQWSNAQGTRILYVAMGGWYNQVELNNLEGKVRAGDTYLSYSSNTYASIHVKVALEGNTITSTVTDESGNELISGSRSSADYLDMSVRNGCMRYLVLRCEDGGVNIDNFKFSAESFEGINETELDIPSGKQAVYSATLTYNRGDKTSLKLGGTDIFTITDEGLRACGCKVNGQYGAGEYGVKAYINPTQKIMYVEIELPDGGILRRGSYQMLGGDRVKCFSSNPDAIDGASVEYISINSNQYQLESTEPSSRGFASKVYNVVSSFDYASSTRYFSWTAKMSFVGNDAMALQYRKKGSSSWITVDAEKAVENTNISAEDYFKADVEGLSPNTEYEYRIGKKDSTDETNDWSPIYSFTTAPLSVKKFSFVAVGDTQSLSWGGDEQNNKGYKYAKAAIDEAIEETGTPAFIFNAGDVTDWGSNRDMWNWYFKALGEYAYSIPHFATMGNHDAWGDDLNNYFSLHLNHPNNGGSAELDRDEADKATGNRAEILLDNMDETFYSYDYGDVHFTVLNSGDYSSNDIHTLNAQREWLEYDLSMNEDAKWKIVMVHEAVYHRLGGSESRPWLYDVIEGYGVDLVIQGHSHLVTRTYPMKDGQIVTKESPDLISKGTGTVYTTIGSTTLNHDVIGNPNVEECLTIITPDNYQPSYTVVDVTENNLVMTVKQLNGYVLDSFTITTGVADEPDNDTPSGDTPSGDQPSDDGDSTGKPDATEEPKVTEAPKATKPDKKGCGGLVGGAAVVIAAVTVFGCGITFKKKHE